MKRLLLILSLFFVVNQAVAVETGEMAPNFTLKSSSGEEISLNQLKGQVVVLEWFNPDCPFVEKHYKNGDMQALQKKAAKEGIQWLTINSTNKDHQSFRTAAQTEKLVSEQGIAAKAVLLDADGTVGKLYSAKTTPHMFVIDANGKLVYQGAIDDNPSASADPKQAKNFVSSALLELAANKEVSNGSTKAYGCSVKY